VKDVVRIEDGVAKTVNKLPYFADGLPGIMYQQADTPMYLNEDQKRLANLYLYGQTIKPIELSTAGKQRVIIVYLYPHVLKNLFGLGAHEIRDDCAEFTHLPVPGGKSLTERLLNLEYVEDQINELLKYLNELFIKKAPTLLPEIAYACEKLMQTGGEAHLKSLQHTINQTERTFQRKFLEHVGVSPQLYRRVCRFHKTLTRLRENNHAKLTELAYDIGFADQSHFIRTFKEFTGLTPREYLVKFR